MTRLCENCGFVNQDDYDFCAKCGNPLVEGLKPKNFIVFKPEQYKINKKAILLSYIITIILSWSGFIVGLIVGGALFLLTIQIVKALMFSLTAA